MLKSSMKTNTVFFEVIISFIYNDNTPLKKKEKRILDLCQLLFFFRVRAVIPLYLLVPSYLALRGN